MVGRSGVLGGGSGQQGAGVQRHLGAAVYQQVWKWSSGLTTRTTVSGGQVMGGGSAQVGPPPAGCRECPAGTPLKAGSERVPLGWG